MLCIIPHVLRLALNELQRVVIMNEYTIITAQNTRNGFLIHSWDMSGAIEKAKEYVRQGWKVYGIVASGEVYNSEALLNRIYA